MGFFSSPRGQRRPPTLPSQVKDLSNQVALDALIKGNQNDASASYNVRGQSRDPVVALPRPGGGVTFRKVR